MSRIGRKPVELPEARIAFDRKPTRQKALSRSMRKPETVQTAAMNRPAWIVEISPEDIAARAAGTLPPASMNPETTAAAAMPAVRSRNVLVGVMGVFGAGCAFVGRTFAAPIRGSILRSRRSTTRTCKAGAGSICCSG